MSVLETFLLVVGCVMGLLIAAMCGTVAFVYYCHKPAITKREETTMLLDVRTAEDSV